MRNDPSKQARRGSTAMEFALMLPLLFALLSAVIDWGYYMTVRVAIARATMDGVRAGAATKDDPATAQNEVANTAQTRTTDTLAGMGRACGAGCTVTATACAVGQVGAVCGAPPIPTIVVQITYPFSPFFGFVPTPPNFQDTFTMAQQAR